jgi:hypothetical protein
MDLYHLALFVHIVTLIVAVAATTGVKLAAARRVRARTIGEALEWHQLMMSSSKLFPICLALFVITGSYMLSRAQVVVWTAGFAVAGLVGVAWLLGSGAFLSVKANALKQVLEGMAKAGPDKPAPKLIPPPVVVALPVVNTGVALGVVFDMVTKPSVPLALGAVVLGAVLGAAPALRRPKPIATAARAS